jgi:hypothetical protein
MMPGARAAWFARSQAGRAQLGHAPLAETICAVEVGSK